MKPIQKGELTTALAAELGLKGRVLPMIDEVIAPIAKLIDITTGPSRVPRSVIAQQSKAAVAGEFSYVGIRAGAGKILAVRQVHIRDVVTANRTERLVLDSPGTALARADTPALYADSKFPTATSPNFVFTGSDALALGQQVGAITTAANFGNTVPFPAPIFLLGPDGRVSGQWDALMVMGNIVNLAVGATFWCDEYELPG